MGPVTPSVPVGPVGPSVPVGPVGPPAPNWEAAGPVNKSKYKTPPVALSK